MLARHPSLWALSLSKWRMSDYGLENLVTVSHAALENHTLRYLDLSWCGDVSIPCHSDAGSDAAHLLARTPMQLRRVKSGAQPLGVVCSLLSWSLPPLCRSNRLTEVSGKVLARLIAANTPLETLRLGCNELHDNAAYDIANALMDNATLVELDLSFNGLTDTALRVRCATHQPKPLNPPLSVPENFMARVHGSLSQDLAHGVRHAQSLSSVKLWGNHFGPSSAEAWGQLLMVRRTSKAVVHVLSRGDALRSSSLCLFVSRPHRRRSVKTWTHYIATSESMR